VGNKTGTSDYLKQPVPLHVGILMKIKKIDSINEGLYGS
jgi:hypothetical protein